MPKVGISDRTKTAVDISDVSTTTKDMSSLFKWKHGDSVRGTQAKAHPGMEEYRRDINKGYGKQDSQKTIYVNTFEAVGKQLEEVKK